MRPRGRFAGRTARLGRGGAAVATGAFSLIVALRRALPLPGTSGTLPAPNVPLDAPWLCGIARVALAARALAATYDEPLASLKERGGLLVASFVAAGLLLALYFLAGRAVPRTVLLLWMPLLWAGLGSRRSPRQWCRSGCGRHRPQGQRGRAAGRGRPGLQPHHGRTLLEWRENARRSTWSGARDVLFASDHEDRRTLCRYRPASSTSSTSGSPGRRGIVASRVVTQASEPPLVPVATRREPLRVRVAAHGPRPHCAPALAHCPRARDGSRIESRGAVDRQHRMGAGQSVLSGRSTTRKKAEKGTGRRSPPPTTKRVTRVDPLRKSVWTGCPISVSAER